MKKKRRSKYGGLNALAKAMPLPEQQVTKMDVAARVAWLKVCEGIATPEDYNVIAWVVNILEQGLTHLNNEDINSTVLNCAAVVSKALNQKLESDSWGLSDKTLPEMQDLLDWHEQLLRLVTVGQLDKLVTTIEERRDREGKYIEVSTLDWEAVRASKQVKGS
jgi:hypothetical protein